MNEINRRQFMKKAIVMGTTIAAFPTVISSESRAENIAKVVVHPNVDNLRVVGITDTAMTKAHEPVSPWVIQDKLGISVLFSLIKSKVGWSMYQEMLMLSSFEFIIVTLFEVFPWINSSFIVTDNSRGCTSKFASQIGEYIKRNKNNDDKTNNFFIYNFSVILSIFYII